MNNEHGEAKIKTLIVDNWRWEVEKPIRHCVRHGWVDAFLWKSHVNCNRETI